MQPTTSPPTQICRNSSTCAYPVRSLCPRDAERIAHHSPGLGGRVPTCDDDVRLVKPAIGHRLEVIDAVDTRKAFEIAQVSPEILGRCIRLELAQRFHDEKRRIPGIGRRSVRLDVGALECLEEEFLGYRGF